MTVTALCREPVSLIAEDLAQRIGRDKYQLWFNATHLEVHDKTLRVAAANRFIADWINRHFHHEIQNAAEAQLGDHAKVEIEVDHRTGEAAATAHQRFNPAATEQVTNPAGSIAPAAQNLNTHTILTTHTMARASDDAMMFGATTQPFKLRHQMDAFIVGRSNRLAYATAMSLIHEQASMDSSPMFIHGACGVGKTHLLQGICERFAHENPHKRWMYLTGEQFTNAYIQAVQQRKLSRFRDRFRKIDLLVVDDVHFFASKSGTQTEFLHTFDAIDMSGRKVVLAADKHPKQVQAMNEALANRFMRGMVVQIEQPDRVLREKLIRGLAQRQLMNLSEAAVQRLAEVSHGSVRELQGLLIKVAAIWSLKSERADQPIGRLAVDKAMDGPGPAKARQPIHFDAIFREVCEMLHTPAEQVRSKSRAKPVVLARALTVYFCRKLTSLSYPEIAQRLGRNNHSTAITAAQRVGKQIDASQKLEFFVDDRIGTVDQLAEALMDRISGKE